MKLQEELYNNTPPSIKTKDIKPFLRAEKSNFWLLCADWIFEFLLKQKFAAVRVKNLENINKRNLNKPCIIYAPHICWWDGILGYYLGRKIFGFDINGMVEDLHAMPLLRKIGAFSVDKKSTKVIKNSVDFAIQNLNSSQKALFIFPQGIIRPQDYTEIKFSSGISYMASKLNGVNLIPIAVRYCFLRSASPEILIDVAEPIFLEKIENRKETTEMIEKHFKNLLKKQRNGITNCDLDGYITVLKQRESLIEFVQKKLKNN